MPKRTFQLQKFKGGNNLNNMKIIGIDPDSKDIVCCLIQPNSDLIVLKTFITTKNGLQKFINWVKLFEDVLIAIEGENGQSTPLEKILKDNSISYYSIPAYRIAKFRKAVLGENKNNCNDAETVARFACTMEQQGKLKDFQIEYEADEELQRLTRDHEYISKACTGELNNLWKHLKNISNDLYLALQGRNPNSSISYKILSKKGILRLFGAKPDISEWRSLKYEEFIIIMGGRNYRGRKTLITQLQMLSQDFKPYPFSLCLSIQLCAQRIIQLQEHQDAIKNELEKISEKKKEIQHLMKIKGIGIITATTMIAEIRDIDRFKSNHKLASYAGIGLVENKTGDNENMRNSVLYNHRLKGAFMQGALTFIIHNPDSHLTGYYKSLLRKGMKKIRALRRVARALIRKIFRELKEFKIKEEQSNIKSKRASDMAIGYNNPIESNIPPATNTYIM